MSFFDHSMPRLAVAGLLAGLLTVAPAWARNASPSGAGGEASLCEEIQSGKAGQELRALRVPAGGVAKAALLGLRQHAADASRLNWNEQRSTGRSDFPQVTTDTLRSVCQAVNPGGQRAFGKGARSALLSSLGKDQRRTLIACLQDGGLFRPAAWMAEAVLDEEKGSSDEGLLRLTAARCEFIGRAQGLSAKGREHLERAAASPDREVAGRAQLLREALEGPRTLEALELNHQIWKTVHHDLSQREKSGEMMRHVLETGPQVLETLRNSSLPPQRKDPLLARAVAIFSEAAFQEGRYDPFLMCIQIAESLECGAPDDRLAPRYFLGLYLFGCGKYEPALAEFERVFFSQEKCDVAADAGMRMAECYAMLHDTDALSVCAQMVLDLYPDQEFAAKRARQWFGRQTPAQRTLVRDRLEKMYPEPRREMLGKRPERQGGK